MESGENKAEFRSLPGKFLRAHREWEDALFMGVPMGDLDRESLLAAFTFLRKSHASQLKSREREKDLLIALKGESR